MKPTDRCRYARARVVMVLVMALPPVIAGAACSLTDVRRDACSTDDQCAAAFGIGSACGPGGYCTDPTVSPTCNGTTDAGLACFACAPTSTPEFENACTAATCVPFDDATRLTKLTADGGLPPLPPFDGGGQPDGGDMPDGGDILDGGDQ
jgi:hypothetical protein